MLHSPSLFVADDDDESRSSVCETLRDDGYDVVEARDGAELLDLLALALSMPLFTPDVVVANVLLPCYSGLGVLGALRRSHWDVPVILVAGPRHPAALAARALRLGATAVFRRPFDMTDLRTAILAARTAPAHS